MIRFAEQQRTLGRDWESQTERIVHVDCWDSACFAFSTTIFWATFAVLFFPLFFSVD